MKFDVSISRELPVLVLPSVDLTLSFVVPAKFVVFFDKFVGV